MTLRGRGAAIPTLWDSLVFFTMLAPTTAAAAVRRDWWTLIESPGH